MSLVSVLRGPLCVGQTICMMRIFRALTTHPQLSTAAATATKTNTPQSKSEMNANRKGVESSLGRGVANWDGIDPSMGLYVTQKSPCIVVQLFVYVFVYLSPCRLVACCDFRSLLLQSARQSPSRTWAYDLCVFWFLPPRHHVQHINKAPLAPCQCQCQCQC